MYRMHVVPFNSRPNFFVLGHSLDLLEAVQLILDRSCRAAAPALAALRGYIEQDAKPRHGHNQA